MHVMDKGGVPHTRYVRGTNYNFISVFPDRLPGRAIVISGAPTALGMALPHAALRWHRLGAQRLHDLERKLSRTCINVVVKQHAHSAHPQHLLAPLI